MLDEPTNHLDLESREALIEALGAFEGTLLMVAHDRYLLAEVADEAWAVSSDGLTVFEGGFTEYDADRRQRNAAAKESDEADRRATQSSGQTPGLSRDELKKLKREQAEQRNALYKLIRPKQERYERCEAELEAFLTEQGAIEAQLADPDVYADSGQASSLLKRFGELRDASEKLMDQMGELEQELAELERQRAALSLDGGE